MRTIISSLLFISATCHAGFFDYTPDEIDEALLTHTRGPLIVQGEEIAEEETAKKCRLCILEPTEDQKQQHQVAYADFMKTLASDRFSDEETAAKAMEIFYNFAQLSCNQLLEDEAYDMLIAHATKALSIAQGRNDTTNSSLFKLHTFSGYDYKASALMELQNYQGCFQAFLSFLQLGIDYSEEEVNVMNTISTGLIKSLTGLVKDPGYQIERGLVSCRVALNTTYLGNLFLRGEHRKKIQALLCNVLQDLYNKAHDNGSYEKATRYAVELLNIDSSVSQAFHSGIFVRLNITVNRYTNTICLPDGIRFCVELLSQINEHNRPTIYDNPAQSTYPRTTLRYQLTKMYKAPLLAMEEIPCSQIGPAISRAITGAQQRDFDGTFLLVEPDSGNRNRPKEPSLKDLIFSGFDFLANILIKADRLNEQDLQPLYATLAMNGEEKSLWSRQQRRQMAHLLSKVEKHLEMLKSNEERQRRTAIRKVETALAAAEKKMDEFPPHHQEADKHSARGKKRKRRQRKGAEAPIPENTQRPIVPQPTEAGPVQEDAEWQASFRRQEESRQKEGHETAVKAEKGKPRKTAGGKKPVKHGSSLVNRLAGLPGQISGKVRKEALQRTRALIRSQAAAQLRIHAVTGEITGDMLQGQIPFTPATTKRLSRSFQDQDIRAAMEKEARVQVKPYRVSVTTNATGFSHEELLSATSKNKYADKYQEVWRILHNGYPFRGWSKGHHFEHLNDYDGHNNAYSVRLNKKHRVVFLIDQVNHTVEIIEIGQHYQKS